MGYLIYLLPKGIGVMNVKSMMKSGGCESMEVHLALKNHPSLDTCKCFTFACPLLGFSQIWAIVPEMALLPTCKASSLSLFFRVNVKEKILDLQGHSH
jgi:hypothetical protein